MSEKKGSQKKKRRIINPKKTCSRCGYNHANDSSGERDASDCNDYWHLECEHVPFNKYLRNFKPESKVGSVESFLLLGELCENLMVYTLIIDHGTMGFWDGIFDVKLFEAFRGKLKVIQDRCLEKAKVALEFGEKAVE